MVAITLYADENNDFFPPNPDDGNTIPGYNWCEGQAGVGGPQEFNPDILEDPKQSLLMPYLRGQVSVFHCPGDKRFGKYQGTRPEFIGQIVSAARTFSMNQAIGTIDPGYDEGTDHTGVPNLSVNGPWLNNQFNHRRNSPWCTYGKTSQIRNPGPSMLWVLVDEDVNGLNDAAFAFGMETPTWLDFPGSYHNRGCGFAFADAHSESHKWSEKPSAYAAGDAITDAGGLRDWGWMQARTSARY